jgi:hypothetical protein
MSKFKCVELYLYSPHILTWHVGEAQGQLYFHYFSTECISLMYQVMLINTRLICELGNDAVPTVREEELLMYETSVLCLY